MGMTGIVTSGVFLAGEEVFGLGLSVPREELTVSSPDMEPADSDSDSWSNAASSPGVGDCTPFMITSPDRSTSSALDGSARTGTSAWGAVDVEGAFSEVSCRGRKVVDPTVHTSSGPDWGKTLNLHFSELRKG